MVILMPPKPEPPKPVRPALSWGMPLPGTPLSPIVLPEIESKTASENPQIPSPTPTPIGGSSPPPPTPPPAPILPTFRPMPNNKNFKVAPSDIIQFDDSSVDIELIKDLLFEDIGATELANISRTDLIDGQDVVYSPIKNLPTVRTEYNPINIVNPGTTIDFFSRFAINLFLRGVYDPYFDNEGNLVIEIESVLDDEEIQAQVLTNGTIALVDDI